MSIVLSISVLSYNNPDKLRGFLLSALPQMRDGVEIIINDNSTNDEIKTMVEEFKSPFIRYIKNKENVGAERNKVLAIERARGEYVWLFGDDEMCEGSVDYVLSVLKEYLSFIFTNFHFIDKNPNNPAIKIYGDIYFKNKNEVLERLSNSLGFMSSLIIKKELVRNINIKELFLSFDFLFTNFYIALHILLQDKGAYFIARPCVRVNPTRVGEADYDGFRVFGVNFYKIATMFKGKFARKSLRKMINENLGYVLRTEIVGGATRNNNKIKKLPTIIKLYWSYKAFWKYLPLLLMPNLINKILYKAFKKKKFCCEHCWNYFSNGNPCKKCGYKVKYKIWKTKK